MEELVRYTPKIEPLVKFGKKLKLVNMKKRKFSAKLTPFIFHLILECCKITFKI